MYSFRQYRTITVNTYRLIQKKIATNKKFATVCHEHSNAHNGSNAHNA